MIKKVYFKNNDIELVGILSVPEKNDSIVILCHGYGSNKDTEKYKLIEKEFSDNGISTFRFDFHGCGESKGKFDFNIQTALLNNVKDLQAAIDFLEKEYKIKKIGLIGSSLGGSTSLMLADDSRVKAIVSLAAPYFDLMKKVTKPVLIYHGTHDEVVSRDHAEKIGKISSKAEIRIIEGADHSFILMPHRQRIVKESMEFLQKYLS